MPQLAAQDEQPAAETPAEDQDLGARVRELVDGLDANQLSKRQEAERQLLELGVDALDFLPEQLGGFSAEAQQRLRRVRQSLQQVRAEAAADAKQLKIGKVSSVQEALLRITELSEITLLYPEELQQPLELNLGTQSFWTALDTVLDAAELDVNFYSGEAGELAIVRRTEGRASRTDSAAYAGVYRIETTAVVARRDLRNPQVSGISVATEIAWEPRLTPIGLTLPLESVVAELDNGEQLRPDIGSLEVSTNGLIPFSQLNIPLPLPAGNAQKITSLRGELRSLLPGAKEKFQVPLDKEHKGETVGDVTVLVEDVRANGTLHEVRVEITFADANKALESHRQWIFENPVYVVDEAGKRIEHLGYETYRQTADRVGIGYLFDLGEQPQGKTLHYETAISIVENEVTFVMRDILLP